MFPHTLTSPACFSSNRLHWETKKADSSFVCQCCYLFPPVHKNRQTANPIRARAPILMPITSGVCEGPSRCPAKENRKFRPAFRLDLGGWVCVCGWWWSGRGWEHVKMTANTTFISNTISIGSLLQEENAKRKRLVMIYYTDMDFLPQARTVPWTTSGQPHMQYLFCTIVGTRWWDHRPCSAHLHITLSNIPFLPPL